MSALYMLVSVTVRAAGIPDHSQLTVLIIHLSRGTVFRGWQLWFESHPHQDEISQAQNAPFFNHDAWGLHSLHRT